MSDVIVCPNCQQELPYGLWDWEFMSQCTNCQGLIMGCRRCASLVPAVNVQISPNTLPVHFICDNCAAEEVFVLKSHVFDFYRFAFKFVNRGWIPYPFYFKYDEEISWIDPIGQIETDWGPVVNNFIYQDRLETGNFSRRDATDTGTSRAFKVSIKLGQAGSRQVEGTCLTHETGLEVFLIAAATLIGTEVAKYSIKWILENLEDSINKWYQKKAHKKDFRGMADPEKPLVEKILVRTPYWEISLDGRFTMEERAKVLDYIGQNLLPQESITEYVSLLEDRELAQKTISTTRAVVRRF